MNDHTNGAPGGGGPRQRHKTRAEERIESLDASPPAFVDSPPALASEVEELRGRVERAEQEAAENRAAWQRSAADFSNYRRRTEQQREEELGLANESLLLKLLAIVDDFDRAVQHVPPELQSSPWVQGIGAIDRKLDSLLESEGVEPIEVEGRPFDPHVSEAILHEETTEAPDGTVLKELVRGYRIRDRVLRPALVAVAKNESPSGDGPGILGNHQSTSADQGAGVDPTPDVRE